MSLFVDIKKDFGAFKLNAAFEADDGVTGLLGASGCGKSMTLKCIAGVEKPDSGHIALDGLTLFDAKKHIDLPPQQRQVGYLFQNYALFPNMTVRQNILCGLRREKDKRAREEQYAKIIGFLGLEGLQGHRPAQLSGGQQQRAALARILVSRPKLLMLDEPFSALDSHLRERLQMEMKGLLSVFEGPALMVTHSRDEAYRLCSRIALMEEGRILASKPTKKLFADPSSVPAAVMTGCKNISPAQKTGEHELYAIDWGIRLQTAAALRDGLCAVGVRAHYFNEQTEQNRFPIEIGEVWEEPFEFTLAFRYASQPADTPGLWWRVAKARRPDKTRCTLGVSPVNALPLYPEG